MRLPLRSLAALIAALLWAMSLMSRFEVTKVATMAKSDRARLFSITGISPAVARGASPSSSNLMQRWPPMHSRVVTARPSSAKSFRESATKIGSDSVEYETAIVTSCAAHAPAARVSAIPQSDDLRLRNQVGHPTAHRGASLIRLLAQHAREAGGELARRHRLLHHLVRLRLARAARDRPAHVAAHQQDRNLAPDPAQLPNQRRAGHPRHALVGDHRVKTPRIRA